jgi:drug/metabolite transporter (DMT)-like permease
MAAMVKLSGDLPLFEKVFFRNLISLFIAYYGIRKSGAAIFGKKENRKYLFGRAFLGLCGVALNFYAISNMYLADASMLNKLSPFFVTIFAWLFLKEKISKVQYPALIIIIIATALIVKPEFSIDKVPAFIGLLSALTSGAAYTLVRYLGDKENPATIVFIFSLFSVVFTLPIALITYESPTLIQFIFLIGTGVFAAGGQYGLTYAYKYAKASETALYNYMNIIFSAIIGYILWEEVSDIYSLIGGATIIAVSLFVYLYNRRSAD